MKNHFILCCLIIFIFSTTLFAQKDTIWYDANWNVASKSQASYYRPVPTKENNGYLLVDYYVSGIKQMEAFSLVLDQEKFDGKVTWYHENGNVMQTVNYKNAVLHGLRKNYYESGPLKSQYSYIDGEIHGDWVAYHENAKLSESGKYKDGERTGPWKTYHKNGKLKEEGEYKKDKKVGIWKVYYYDGIESEGQ